jgi:ribosome-associated heat shock protein Hsp15
VAIKRADAAPQGVVRVAEPAETCRADVWLWRARFFKSRGLATRMIEEGAIRLVWSGAEIRLNKPRLVPFLRDRRLAVRIEALGERRGPAREAQMLYRVMENAAQAEGGRDGDESPGAAPVCSSD